MWKQIKKELRERKLSKVRIESSTRKEGEREKEREGEGVEKGKKEREKIERAQWA
jgi:hypothetical protein